MISNTSYLIKILSPKNWENDIGWAYLQQRKNEVTKGFHYELGKRKYSQQILIYLVINSLLTEKIFSFLKT
jgi:hypothetical protein